MQAVFKWTLIGVALVTLIFVYKYFNPYQVSFFPKCPFKSGTGLECPGCGSQRAVHYILNFQMASAFRENALLVISIPYVLLGIVVENFKVYGTMARIRDTIYGYKAMRIIAVIVVLWWLFRNIL